MAVDSKALVQFRAGQLAGELNSRPGSVGGVAKRDLERYYFLIDRYIDTIDFNFPEALLSLEILRSIPFSLSTARFAGTIIEEKIREILVKPSQDWHLARAVALLWDIESEAKINTPVDDELVGDFEFSKGDFIEKLKNLQLCQLIALWDASERYLKDLHGDIIDQIGLCSDLRIVGLFKPKAMLSERFADNCAAVKQLLSHLRKAVLDESEAI